MATHLTPTQRDKFAEKFMDWGNLVFAGLVVAQVFPGPLSKPGMVVVGILCISGAYWLAFRLMKGGGE